MSQIHEAFLPNLTFEENILNIFYIPTYFMFA